MTILPAQILWDNGVEREANLMKKNKFSEKKQEGC